MDKLEPRAVCDRKINDHIAKCHRLRGLSRTICLDFLLIRDHQSSRASEHAAVQIPRSDEQIKSPHLQLLENSWNTPSADVANFVQQCHFRGLQLFLDHGRYLLQYFARARV